MENLIKKINTPFESEINVSWGMQSWKARREAGKLSDTALLPVSEQIIDEHRGESDGERDVRISWDSTVKRVNAGLIVK